MQINSHSIMADEPVLTHSKQISFSVQAVEVLVKHFTLVSKNQVLR